MYEVLIERAAERDLKKLPAREFQRIIAAIKALAGDPRPHGCRKISGSQHDWRIRVRTLRVVYEIDDKAKIVRVMRVNVGRRLIGRGENDGDASDEAWGVSRVICLYFRRRLNKRMIC